MACPNPRWKPLPPTNDDQLHDTYSGDDRSIACVGADSVVRRCRRGGLHIDPAWRDRDAISIDDSVAIEITASRTNHAVGHGDICSPWSEAGAIDDRATLDNYGMLSHDRQ